MALFTCTYRHHDDDAVASRHIDALNVPMCFLAYAVLAKDNDYSTASLEVALGTHVLWAKNDGDYDRIDMASSAPHLTASESVARMAGKDDVRAVRYYGGVLVESNARANGWTRVRAMLHLEELGAVVAENDTWRPLVLSAHQRLALHRLPDFQARDAALRGGV
jgi:hypothetical protein